MNDLDDYFKIMLYLKYVQECLFLSRTAFIINSSIMDMDL